MDDVFRRGLLSVRWVSGGLHVEAGPRGLLMDAPVAAVRELAGMRALPRLGSVVLSSGRMQSVDGLIPLLCATSGVEGEGPMAIRYPLQDERAVLLAGAWSQCWPDRRSVLLDGVMPGRSCGIGPFELSASAVPHGEPHGADTVRAAPGVAYRLRALGVTIAYVPGSAPGGEARRVCRDVDLAVVEVGRVPWPETDRRWRMTVSEALEAGEGAEEVWLVGDDGTRGPWPDEVSN